jgi:hypothetical protein
MAGHHVFVDDDGVPVKLDAIDPVEQAGIRILSQRQDQ